jgi:hypothetical protein
MQNDKDKEPFTSESVDEQVERLAHLDEIHRTSADQQVLSPEARLVQEMSKLYQEYAGTRDRVWQRLEQHMQQPSLTQRSITGKLMVYERKPWMIRRELERGSGIVSRLTLIAAVLIIVLLVGSMTLIPSALKTLRNSHLGGPGHAPTVTPFASTVSPTATAANTDCPFGTPTDAGQWRDAAEQAVCLAHQETPLHIMRTIDNHEVDFVAAYADKTRLVILYIEHIDPRSDAISFMNVTLQDGTTLPGGAYHSYGDVQAHLLYAQVWFETTSLPANTTTLHVQSMLDAMSSNAVPLGFTVPLHSTTEVPPAQ